jgi:hypothetical protein
MNIKLWIDADTVRVAIAHSIQIGEKITSFKKFKQAVANYISMYGESCVDDHETEAEKEAWDKASDLLQKYLPETKHLLK